MSGDLHVRLNRLSFTLVEEQGVRMTWVSHQSCLPLVLVQPLCRGEYSRQGTERCGLELLLPSAQENPEMRALRIARLPVGSRVLSPRLVEKWEVEGGCSPRDCRLSSRCLVSFESGGGGRNPGLWLSIFAFVRVAEINVGIVTVHRNDLFLHSLAQCLSQACA